MYYGMYVCMQVLDRLSGQTNKSGGGKKGGDGEGGASKGR